MINSQEKTLQIQRTGIKETLKRQLANLVNTYNAIIQFYAKTEQRENLALSNIEILNFKFLVGEKIDLLSLADAFEVRTLSQAAKLEQLYRFQLSQDRLQRLLLEGEFSKLPATIEEIEK